MYHIKRSPRYIIKEKKQWAEYCKKEVEGNNIYTYLLIKAQVISGMMQKRKEEEERGRESEVKRLEGKSMEA